MKPGLTRFVGKVPYAFIVSALLFGCSNTQLSSPTVAAAKDSANPVRMVTVRVMASPSNGFLPVFQDRIITAEVVTTTTKIKAEAMKRVQGVTTIVVGRSCTQLTRDYPDATECNEVDTAIRHYGEVEVAAKTDREGIAVLKLDSAQYRISMQTWQTVEDKKCSWSGSEILPENSRVLELPVLVFCE